MLKLTKAALALLAALAFTGPALAQIPGGSDIQIGITPVIGGTNTNCLNITTGKVGQVACSGGGAAGITVGTSVITGGTNGRMLYDNSGVLGELPVTGTAGNVVLSISPTLTTPALGAATGTSLALGGATIGSNALAVTGTSNLNGAVTFLQNNTGPAIQSSGNANSGFGSISGNPSIWDSASLEMRISGDVAAFLGIGLGATPSGPDTYLRRDAANTLAQRNGVNAQNLRVYNTFTDASNYERGTINWTDTANVLTLGAKAAGTGTARPVAIVGAGVEIGVSNLTLTSGALGLAAITASASAPGAAGGKLELVCGTNAGSAKLVAYAGTSGTAATVLDNIGTGVTGC